MDDGTLADELLRSTARLSRWASRNASFEVPAAQARLLSLLEELGPARISELARADHTSQPTTTAQVGRIEAAGWAARSPDPDDARAIRVTLTPAGAQALADVRRARAQALTPALSRLDAAGRARLVVAVAALHDLLVATDEPTPPDLRKDS